MTVAHSARIRTQRLFYMVMFGAVFFGVGITKEQAHVFSLSAPAALAQGQDDAPPAFFQGLGDVPLMPGLYEGEGGAVIFDKPDGRIAETHAHTDEVSEEEIRDFYAETLPHLGWAPVGNLIFQRENERLEITIIPQEGWRFVRIMISPRRSDHKSPDF